MTVLSLIYTGLLALGIFTFDAWLHPDIINLSLTLPKGLGASETSIGDAVAENLFARGLCLPSGTAMELDDVERVAGIVKGVAARGKGRR